MYMKKGLSGASAFCWRTQVMASEAAAALGAGGPARCHPALAGRAARLARRPDPEVADRHHPGRPLDEAPRQRQPREARLLHPHVGHKRPRREACGVAAVAPLVIPPAHAQTTQRWEMMCTTFPVTRNSDENVRAINSVGNAAGREGWEPFAVENLALCFRRPAP